MDSDFDEIAEDQVLTRFGSRTGGLLIEYGFASLEAVREASDKDLLKISGVGKGTLKMIRARQDESFVLYDEEGVSDEPATVESEVKPESTEAEAVEGDDAEASSAVEATSAEMSLPSGWTGMVAMRSLWPSAMRIVGPSGTEYLWPRAGAEVNVLAQDVEFVLSRNRNKGRACCGGSGERIKFELA